MPAIVWTSLGVILALAGALGVAYAVFRSTTVTKTVELYKSENEVQGKAIARQALQLAEQEARILVLERENAILRDLVIGKEQLDMLLKDSIARHVEYERTLDVLTEIKGLLGEMWRSLIKTMAEDQK